MSEGAQTWRNDAPLSFTISPSHIHTHTQPLTGENIHCQWKRWSGTDGIRMIETTYNSFHNFPIFSLLSFADYFSPCRSVSVLLPNSNHRLDAWSPADSTPSSLAALAREAQALWNSHDADQAAKRRKTGGRAGERGTVLFLSAPIYLKSFFSY